MDASRRLAPAILAAALVVTACSSAGASPAPDGTAATAVSAAPASSSVASSSPSPAASAGDCVTRSDDYTVDARGPKGDPVELARAALSGLGASDSLTRGNGEAGVVVIVVRDGDEVGRVHFTQDPDGGWLLDTAVLCAGLGSRDASASPSSPPASHSAGSLPAAETAPEAPRRVTATKAAALCPGETGMRKFPCIVADLAWEVVAGPPAAYRVYQTMTGEGPGATCHPADGQLVLTTAAGATSARVGPFEPATGSGDRCLYVAAANAAGESERVQVPGGFMVLP